MSGQKIEKLFQLHFGVVYLFKLSSLRIFHSLQILFWSRTLTSSLPIYGTVISRNKKVKSSVLQFYERTLQLNVLEQQQQKQTMPLQIEKVKGKQFRDKIK